MAREKRERRGSREREAEQEKGEAKPRGFLKSFREETIEGIWAVIFLLAAAFLALAPFRLAGRAGELTFQGLDALFGVGYYLAPLLLLALGVSYFRDLSRNLALPKAIGGLVAFVAGLNLVDVFSRGQGGIVGGAMSGLLVSAFDTYFTVISMAGLFAIGLAMLLDAPFSALFSAFRGRKDAPAELPPIEPVKITSGGEVVDDRAAEKAEEKPKREEAPEEDGSPVGSGAGKKASGLVFFSRRAGPSSFTPPPLTLLETDSGKPGVGDVKANANVIRRTLSDFGIQVEMDEVSIGPSVTRYALKPAQGIKLSKIEALHKDLALALAAHPIRIEAPIPGKSLVGIEIPNTTKTTVGLGSMLRNPEFQESDKPLLFALGKDVTGNASFADLGRAPHMLVAGTTGSGKSVTIHAIITSLLYRNGPDDLKFIMVDPKRVELTLYNGIPHLLTPVITDAKKAILALRWAAKEMADRYDTLERFRVRDVGTYRREIHAKAVAKRGKDAEPAADEPPAMPYIAIVIDELADIMQTYPRELEAGIVRLAQMSRAVGIHLILSTQRPSVNVITGLIKANIPTRVALQVASQIDSRTIIDMPGAEKLLGRGDMLYLPSDKPQPTRLQSANISEKEVKAIVDHLREEYETDGKMATIDLDAKSGGGFSESLGAGLGGGDDEGADDDMYEEAREVVVKAGRASTSFLQRRLRVGYARAARIMDILEERGVIGPGEGAKPREVLVKAEGFGAEPSTEEEPRDGMLG